VLTIFGGKNPHPNVAVGGAPCAISVGGKLPGGGDATAVSMTGLIRVRQLIETDAGFVDGVYLPDLAHDRRRLQGLVHARRKCPQLPDLWGFRRSCRRTTASACRAARCWIAICRQILPVDLTDPAQIQEYVAHSWYKYSTGRQ
jgi:hydrogenase large subunit